MAEALNRFYAAPENAGLPLGVGLTIFDRRLKGDSEAAINEALRLFRQQYLGSSR
jgi:hypothetical protein